MDRHLLQSRESDERVEALHIFPTNAQVNTFNAQALSALCLNEESEPVVI